MELCDDMENLIMWFHYKILKHFNLYIPIISD